MMRKMIDYEKKKPYQVHVSKEQVYVLEKKA